MLLLLLFYCAFCVAVKLDDPSYSLHQRRVLQIQKNGTVYPHSNGTNSTLNEASKLVAEAVALQSKYNAYRVAHPRRNTYRSEPPAHLAHRDHPPTPPVLEPKLLAAAALLAEHDALQKLANGTLHRGYQEFTQLPKPVSVSANKKRSSAPYWPSQVDHGQPPMGWDPSYPVYRDVTDPKFGAKGDGVTDDTAAINAAIAFGGNCGKGCPSSTTKGTFIYFPPGTYLISTPINAFYYSQLVGNPHDMPIIKTSASFVGLGAIQSDVYIPGASGSEWYIEQNNFYRQVRNFVIDITQTTTGNVAGLHWQVAQATSLTNVNILASSAPGTTQMGMYTENGSGGFMSNTNIVGGKYGIYGGNQQYTVRDFQISGQETACICLIWDWGWTWSQLYLANAPVGISLINPQAPSGQQAGSTYVMDTHFHGTSTAIEANIEKKTILETSIITLDNIGVEGVDTMVKFASGEVLSIPAADIDFAIVGNVEEDGSHFGYFNVSTGRTPPTSLLTGKTRYARDVYFSKERPQYEDLDAGSIVSVKNHGAVGDGSHDDTSAIVSALSQATTSNLIYFPPGSYIITSTILIPAHARITGQVWSQLVASGPFFSNMTSPKPMIQVGKPGDVGTVEITDILFTSVGELPGLVMMEWNVQEESQGSVGIWDSHFRVGGAYGSKLQVAQCPKTLPIQPGCVAASMMMHIAPDSSGYFENMWAWVADHDIDDASETQVTVAVGRGILAEDTKGPIWLYGTASEHSMLYQYSFINSSNTFAGMIQTESPYFQFTEATESPGPFNTSLGLFKGDPSFPDSSCSASSELCNFSWAVILKDTTNLTISGAGLYSWYDNYLEECVDTQNCQQRLVNDAGGNFGLSVWNLVTIGSVEMVSNTETQQSVYAKNNTQAIGHPFWSALAGYLDDQEPEILSCDDDSTDPACLASFKCDLRKSYRSLDDLKANAKSFPNQCMGYYALNTIYSILNDTLTNYTSTNKNYDKYFGDYVEYTKDMVGPALNVFMAGSTPKQPQGGPGNKYFDCTCEGYGPTSTQQCPFTYKQLAGALGFKMTYTLKDEKGFFDDLEKNYAINHTWVTFGNKGHPVRPVGPCHYDICPEGTDYEYINLPKAAPKKNMHVSNPKDVISKAMPKILQLKDNILARQIDVNLGQWSGPVGDLLQSFSMPVFMLEQAVASMAEVKKIGEKEAQEKKIHLILEILGIAFAFIPFLDDLTPEIEVLDGVFETISTLGNAGLGIQSIVSDPKSAPMDLLAMLTGPSGRSEEEFAKMAKVRRSLTEDEVGKIGKDFKAKDQEFQDTIKRSCRT